MAYTMKINKIKIYFQFYKSTLGINVSISAVLSIILYFTVQYPIVYSYALFSMSLGYFISILVKESSFSNHDESYFYYNFGITKTKLFIICGSMNVVFAIIIIAGYFYAK